MSEGGSGGQAVAGDTNGAGDKAAQAEQEALDRVLMATQAAKDTQRSRAADSSAATSTPSSTATEDSDDEFWQGVDASIDRTLDKFDFDLSGFNKKKTEIPFQKQRDKIYFTFGVINVCTIAYCAGGHPGFLAPLYTAKFPLLIGLRYIFYRGRKWHYFLLDFCYFANMLLLLYLWVLNDSPEVFMMLFGVTVGPLGWAVLAFRNSLVFHSLDKITSAFIHITPLTLTYVLRHRTKDMWAPHYVDCDTQACPDKFFWLTIAPTGFFVAHQILYWVMIKLVLCIPEDPKYLTSYRYLTQDKRSAAYKAVNCCGGKCKELIFSILYSTFAFLTMLPAYFFFECGIANLIFAVFVIVMAVWNGANFYVEVFTRGYGSRKKRSKLPPKPPKTVRSVSFLAR